MRLGGGSHQKGVNCNGRWRELTNFTNRLGCFPIATLNCLGIHKGV